MFIDSKQISPSIKSAIENVMIKILYLNYQPRKTNTVTRVQNFQVPVDFHSEVTWNDLEVFGSIRIKYFQVIWKSFIRKNVNSIWKSTWNHLEVQKIELIFLINHHCAKHGRAPNSLSQCFGFDFLDFEIRQLTLNTQKYKEGILM